MKMAQLKDVADFQAGFGFPVKYQGLETGDYPFVKVGDISEAAKAGQTTISSARHYINEETLPLIKAKPLPKGSIVFAKIGEAISQNFRAITGCKLLIDNNTMGMIPNLEKVDTKFLFYFMRQLDLYPLASMTSVPSLRKSTLENITIPVPPLGEQQRIAAILDKADALRAKRRAALAKLDTLLQATFLHMFGDPVTNPMGWPVQRLDKFGIVTTGSTPSRKNPEYYGTFIEWIKSDNINTPYHILTHAQEYLSEVGVQVGRTVPANSILVTCIAGSPDCIGNVAIADREVSFNQQINALTPTNEGVTFFLYTQFLVGKKLVQNASTNSMKGMVNKSAFSSVEFVSPPLELQLEFSQIAERIQKETEKQTYSVDKHNNLFHSLQQRAFKGEL
jgi:type I restriction enzyme, S subunit